METLDKVIKTAKEAYRESIIIDNEKIQDLLLSIITMTDQLRNVAVVNKRHVASRDTIPEGKYKDMACIAYVLSEFGHQVFDSNKTQAQVIEEISNILGTKSGTIRNMRDFLDTYTNSPREGWKKPLADRLQDVFDECKSTVPPEMTIERAKSILLKYERGAEI